MRALVTLIVCLLHLVSVVRSQSCSATVFGTDLPKKQPSSAKKLFVNAQSPASCSGILTLWHYCFYNEQAGNNGITRFAIYRRDSANSYSRVYTEDKITVSIPSSPSFSCRTLTPSQSNFQVEPEDIILACIDEDRPLDVLAESASGYQVYQSSDSIEHGCGNMDIPGSISLNSYSRSSDFALHVYAEINECGVSNGGCAQVCTDLSVGYECSCDDGYTLDGDGVSCSDVDECAVSNGGCDHICDNDEGSFECHCNYGFLLQEDGLICLIEPTGIVIGVVVVLLSIAMCIIAGLLIAVGVMYRRKKQSFSSRTSAVHMLNPNYFYVNGSRLKSDESPDTRLKTGYELLSEDDDCCTFAYTDEPPDYQNVMTQARNSIAVGDANPYESPASEEKDIYVQLKKHRIINIPQKKIKVNGYMGSGQFGRVNKGVWFHSKGIKEVALKTLKEDATQTDRVKFLQEAAIMGQFRHANVTQLYGVVAHGKTLMLVIELASKGDLKHLLRTMRPDPGLLVGGSTAQKLLEYSQQTALGMNYLSGKGFVHRDLAARNILVSSDNLCKVADFGMSRDLANEEADYYVSQGGVKIPVKWTAPEALIHKKYSTASDVWSYGCLLYEIWSLGHKPFEKLMNSSVPDKLTAGHRPLPPPGCPKRIYELMMDCWHPEAVDRPSFREVVQALLEHEDSLLHIPPEALSSHSQAGMLGAPLEAGMLMYTDTQKMYFVEGETADDSNEIPESDYGYCF